MAKADKKNGGDLGFEAELFKAADKLRGNMEPSDYKHVVLGLIFLKYISDAFDIKHQDLLANDADAAEDRDEYAADNVFWVPKDARWSYLQANAKQPTIGTLIDDAMRVIEKDNESLKGVLPKDYARPALNKIMLGELIDLISKITLGADGHGSKDVLGRVYEYFLGRFAGAEGKGGGEFYTPRSVVQTLVEMLEPFSGRVYDPCCGSGGMFVQSEKFVKEHGGRIGDIAIYGQESNYTTWRLAKMNLAVRGIDSDIKWNNEGSFHKDELRDLKADYIIANPPFNISDWGGERLRDDVRWKYGVPPASNANYAWLQHIVHHLAPNGTAGVVLAVGSMASNQSGEGEIRQAMIKGDVVDCMVALPAQLFYSTTIPACLWFLARNKNPGKGLRNRTGQILFIDAQKFGAPVERTRKELTDDEIQRIVSVYHSWRGEEGAGEYQDIDGLCRSVSIEEVEKQGYTLTPSNYIKATSDEGDNELFELKMTRLVDGWREQKEAISKLDSAIEGNLDKLGYFNCERTRHSEIAAGGLKTRSLNQSVEVMARTLFEAWFVNLDPIRAKLDGRWQRGQSLPGLPAFLYDLVPDKIIESEFGNIPEGWELRSLDSIATFLNGLAMQKFPPESTNEFLPVIKIAQLRSGSSSGADKASVNIKPEYVVHDGDVLFSWSGTLEVEVWNGGKGALNQHLFKVSSNEVPKWFYYFATRHHLPKFRSIAAGKATTMGHIQRKHLNEARVLLAPPSLMAELDLIINPLFDRLATHEK
jgi:type I restriction enzyme M protein